MMILSYRPFVSALCFILFLQEGRTNAQSALRSSSSSSERVLQLLGSVCQIVSRLLPGDVLCDCALAVGLTFACEFQSPICLGGFCSSPSVAGDISLLRTTLAFQFCLLNPTRNGVPTNGFCINVGGAGDAPLSISAPDEVDSAVLTGCTATSVDGTTPCNSCALCNDGTGYTFDCTNLGDTSLIQSTCTPLSVITSLDPDQDITFFPHLDALN
jgi:hypothetical protein